VAVSFIGGGNWRKPPILPQVTDKLSHNVVLGAHCLWQGELKKFKDTKKIGAVVVVIVW
jgi:hypothetical protein